MYIKGWKEDIFDKVLFLKVLNCTILSRMLDDVRIVLKVPYSPNTIFLRNFKIEIINKLNVCIDI